MVAGEVLGGRFDGLVMEEFDDDTITALAKGLGLRADARAPNLNFCAGVPSSSFHFAGVCGNCPTSILDVTTHSTIH